MIYPMKTVVIGAVIVSLLALGACGGLKRVSGKGKYPPDEFAVVTQPELVMPPEYSLRPPRPGEPSPQTLAPAAETLRALFPQNEDVIPQVSSGEAALLRNIEAQPLANVRPRVGDRDTEVVEKGTLLEDIVGIDERDGAVDGSSIEHVGSEPEDGGN